MHAVSAHANSLHSESRMQWQCCYSQSAEYGSSGRDLARAGINFCLFVRANLRSPRAIKFWPRALAIGRLFEKQAAWSSTTCFQTIGGEQLRVFCLWLSNSRARRRIPHALKETSRAEKKSRACSYHILQCYCCIEGYTSHIFLSFTTIFTHIQ